MCPLYYYPRQVCSPGLSRLGPVGDSPQVGYSLLSSSTSCGDHLGPSCALAGQRPCRLPRPVVCLPSELSLGMAPTQLSHTIMTNTYKSFLPCLQIPQGRAGLSRVGSRQTPHCLVSTSREQCRSEAWATGSTCTHTHPSQPNMGCSLLTLSQSH